jgi:hypothetical protein
MRHGVVLSSNILSVPGDLGETISLGEDFQGNTEIISRAH